MLKIMLDSLLPMKERPAIIVTPKRVMRIKTIHQNARFKICHVILGKNK